MNALVGQLSILNVPCSILEHAISLPYIEQFFADSAGGESAFVREAMADGLNEVASAGSDILCEMIGAVVRVACFVACYELFEVVEQAFFVLGEKGVWVLGRRDLVFVLEEFGGES
jgi:hypothetical protein